MERLARPGTVRRAASVALLAATVSLTAGCHVRLISEYDPVIDASFAELATELDALLAKLEAREGTPAAAYAVNEDSYFDVAAGFRTLRMRASVAPKSGAVVEQLDLILENIQDLQELHRSKGEVGLSAAHVRPAREAFAVQFESFFRLQAALRRE